ncbi:hypothetical protein [Salinimicrobium sp. TH3]|uniref:hypothetical protein n=1 Tax=Salinimicrobium sp. TH3 TaxID=2997342 RepID=UPI0022728AE0|nr:hypothetical protein [Salinimicrobium sp. TH3]MCY2685867.1 hypothetical protein [Salinimicrobium sp. TH3]
MKYLGNLKEQFLQEILSKKKVLVGSELSEKLKEKFNVRPDNARKIIQRACEKKLINSSQPMSFGKGQFAYSLGPTKLTKEKIKIISKIHRPPLFRLLAGLEVNDGILSYYEALKITASPLEKSSTKVDTLEDLIDLLQKAEILQMKSDINSVKYLIFNSREENESIIEKHFAKMLVDTAMIKDILAWFIKSNLIDNQNIIYRNRNNPFKGAKHNNLIWDAFAYTKTTGLNPRSAESGFEKQTLVAFDILINRDYEEFDLDGFVSRIQINLNSVKEGKRKILPIIIYKKCSNKVENKIKKLGFLSYDLGSIYGSNILKILENLSKISFDKEVIEYQNFDQIIEDTLATIHDSGQEEQLKAIKGTLFEVMMYQVLRNKYPSSEIQSNYYYRRGKGQVTEGYEYDYVIRSSNPKEIVIVELKGYKANYEIPLGDSKTKGSISWFFRKTLPFIKEKFQNDISEGYQFRGCYITTGGYSKDALDSLKKLNESKLKPKDLEIFYDRKELLNLMETKNFHQLKKIIEKFYA